MPRLLTAFATCIVLLSACQQERDPAVPEAQPISVSDANAAVQTGAAVWYADGFVALRGKRVGLITNHTGRVDTLHLADALHAAEGVTLAALFGPEHGLRGDADAGEKVDDGIDDATGAPIYSLYGRTRKPTPGMLTDVDVLVFDIQDIGARFYTYISTMGYAMQAAAEAGLPFVVFDRPNPLGGDLVEGWTLEPEHTSFVGAYPIPVVHGLTVGELAQMIQGESWLDGLDALDLTVVPMQGWSRAMRWPDTGLAWVPTSPNIPDFETAQVYAGTCFFEGTTASEGRGTATPFRLVGAPEAPHVAIATALNATDIRGVSFTPEAFAPRSIPGMSSNPKLKDRRVNGVRLAVTDPVALQPVAAGIHVLHAFYQAQPDGFLSPDWLAKLAGTNRLRTLLLENATPDAIVASWADDVGRFEALRAPYLLYD
ncbi:MAG: DUF1343 domain-containing protein [Bacteroidota bacterium]